MIDEMAEIGRLSVKLDQDKVELDNLNKCSAKMAEQLRAIADCLDPTNKISQVLTVIEDGKLFVANHHSHPEARSADMVYRPNDPPGSYVFPIPVNVAALMERTCQVTREIAEGEKLLKKQIEKKRTS